jgi:hypothetical protein
VVLTVDGRVMLVSPAAAKADVPILTNPAGRDISSSASQNRNALFPILVRVEGRTTEDRIVHPEKALAPREGASGAKGQDSDCRNPQFRNALSPMVFSAAGRTTRVSLAPENA